jgi:RNA polymerase sigma-B factor
VVTDALQAGMPRVAGSLDEPLRSHDDQRTTVIDRAPAREDQIAGADARITLEQVSRTLDRRSREVVRLRYRDDLLQREIAERVGCSQMQVSRILQEAIRRMQVYAAATG